MDSESVPQSSRRRLDLDLSVYPIGAIQKAAYEFSCRACCAISHLAENFVSVEFELLAIGGDRDDLVRQFLNRLTDFSVQSRIDADTRLVREALISAAMAEALRK